MYDESKPSGGPPPEAVFFQLITGKWVTQAIASAARFGVADELKEGARGVDEIARAVGADEGALYRLLRALGSLGFFTEDGERRFALTPLGEKLVSDSPGSLRAFAMMMGLPETWNAWGAFDHSIRTGDSAFTHVFGKPFFQHLQENPESARIFDDAMTAISSTSNPAVAGALDWARFGRVADVGGGEGSLLCEILGHHDGVGGLLYDLPHVVATAEEVLAENPLRPRVETRGGDFFVEVPEGADAYVMKHIVHDWGDTHCRTLLANCREAMPADGRVMIVESIIPPGNDPFPTKLLDLEMLVMCEGGKERTEREYRDLLASAGLALEAIHPTKGSLSVLEARRA